MEGVFASEADDPQLIQICSLMLVIRYYNLFIFLNLQGAFASLDHFQIVIEKIERSAGHENHNMLLIQYYFWRLSLDVCSLAQNQFKF